MTKTKITALSVAMLLGVGAAQAADQRDFWIVNDTGLTSIEGARIAVARPGTPWAKVALSSPIGPQRERKIYFTPGEAGSGCFFDIELSLDSGRKVPYGNVNLCRIERLVLTP
jgi:hypothetical protein